MVRVLGVSPSGFHAWRDRAPSRRQRCDEVLKACIGRIHQRSRGTYGAPRIHAELAEDGVRVARKRVARLMRHMGLAGVSRRKGTRTTRRTPTARPAPDLVARRFQADAPDRLWVADITCVPSLAPDSSSSPSSSMRLAAGSLLLQAHFSLNKQRFPPAPGRGRTVVELWCDFDLQGVESRGFQGHFPVWRELLLNKTDG